MKLGVNSDENIERTPVGIGTSKVQLPNADKPNSSTESVIDN